ncbi:hypothetical protein [Paenibacillus albus]|uniref:hypothetical protein n=1 Tax=Paenibacillus albus TaxID=2495582 RepID=UPI0013DF66DB|nr:hypothetical protein [Paenibacillus albus]
MGIKIYAYIMILLGLVCIAIVFIPPHSSTVRTVLYLAVGLWSIFNGVKRLRR